MKSRISQAVLIAAVVLCWVICTIAQLEKYLSVRNVRLSLAAGTIAIVAIMLLLKRGYRTGRDLGSWTLPAAFLLLASCFLVIYPMSQRHAKGMGSDREDALRVELAAISHHQYPYAARTFLGNAPTPLPGALLLASPFYLAGRIALQNLLWSALFVVFMARFFSRNSTAVAFLLIFAVASLENLNDFVVGGDYFINILYIAIAIYLFVCALRQEKHLSLSIAACFFMGVVLSSRIIYVVAMVPLLAIALQSTTRKRAFIRIAFVLLFFSLVTFSVFLPHPIRGLLNQLAQNSGKMVYLPTILHPQVTLPLAAIAIACTSFWGRMSVARVYLVTGLSTLVMILPPMASIVHAEGGLLQRALTPDLLYLATSAVFISLWLFHVFENAALKDRELPPKIDK